MIFVCGAANCENRAKTLLAKRQQKKDLKQRQSHCWTLTQQYGASDINRSSILSSHSKSSNQVDGNDMSLRWQRMEQEFPGALGLQINDEYGKVLFGHESTHSKEYRNDKNKQKKEREKKKGKIKYQTNTLTQMFSVESIAPTQSNIDYFDYTIDDDVWSELAKRW